MYLVLSVKTRLDSKLYVLTSKMLPNSQANNDGMINHYFITQKIFCVKFLGETPIV